MIDNFALALSHGLMILAAWRLIFRGDLDDPAATPAAEARRGWRPVQRDHWGERPGGA